MIADLQCFACREWIDWREALAERADGLEERTHGTRYARIECPGCGETYALVVDPGSHVLYECTWNDEPCGEPGCEHCLNGGPDEYVERWTRPDRSHGGLIGYVVDDEVLCIGCAGDEEGRWGRLRDSPYYGDSFPYPECRSCGLPLPEAGD